VIMKMNRVIPSAIAQPATNQSNAAALVY